MNSPRYAIAPFVDIHVLNNQEIQIRLLAKTQSDTISIEGDGISDLLKILRAIYFRAMSVDEILGNLGLQVPKEDCQKILGNLVNLGVLSHDVHDKKRAYGELLVPYRLSPILDGRYVCIRNTQYIYISAVEEGDALANAALHQSLDQDDVNIALCITRPGLSYECLPSVDITLDKLEFSQELLKPGRLKLNSRGGLQSAFPILEEYHSSNSRDAMWLELLTKGLGSNIISTVQKIDTASWAIQPSGSVYRATHRIHDLEQAHDDFQLGIGSTDLEACGKAVMEAFERYSGRMTHQQVAGVVYASKAQLDEDCIDISALARYSELQFRGNKIPQGLELPCQQGKGYWIAVRNIHGEQKYVPANFVYYSFRSEDFASGKNTFWSNSNGIAAHIEFDKAIISAVLETIERDAILIWWLNRISPPIVASEILDEWSKGKIQTISDLGFEVEVLDITLDTLPVALVVARNKKQEWPYFFCGAACSIRFGDAANKALQELLISMGNELYGDQTDISIQDQYTINQPMDHARVYYDPAMSGFVDFLFKGDLYQRVSHPEEEITTTNEVDCYLRQKGFQLWYLDITAPEIRGFDSGVVVVKVVIPGMVPITFGYMSEPLGMNRITDLPLQMGLVKTKKTVNDLLKDYMPHFFP